GPDSIGTMNLLAFLHPCGRRVAARLPALASTGQPTETLMRCGGCRRLGDDGDANVDGTALARVALVGAHVELDVLAFVEVVEDEALQACAVEEDVFRFTGRPDEAEAAVALQALDLSCCHEMDSCPAPQNVRCSGNRPANAARIRAPPNARLA